MSIELSIQQQNNSKKHLLNGNKSRNMLHNCSKYSLIGSQWPNDGFKYRCHKRFHIGQLWWPWLKWCLLIAHSVRRFALPVKYFQLTAIVIWILCTCDILDDGRCVCGPEMATAACAAAFTAATNASSNTNMINATCSIEDQMRSVDKVIKVSISTITVIFQLFQSLPFWC